jgi:hypothetical protein
MWIPGDEEFILGDVRETTYGNPAGSSWSSCMKVLDIVII